MVSSSYLSCYTSSLGYIYEGFYKAEKGVGVAVQRVTKLVTHRTIYPEICLQLYFIKENCQRLMLVLTSLEEKQIPLASKVFNILVDLKADLKFGQEKTTFGVERDRLISKLAESDRKKYVNLFRCLPCHLKNK